MRFTTPAKRDFVEVMHWSRAEFGMNAPRRYKTLIEQAVVDLAEDAFRPRTRDRGSMKAGLYTFHLSSSRDRVEGERVKRPRHFLLYLVFGREVQVLRILHDSGDLARYVRES